jgi:hypothetical protein
LIAAVLIVWVALDSGDSEGEAASTPSAKAEIVSVAALRKATVLQDTPIYWAGQNAGTELELSKPSADRTYVRYLTAGAKAGDPRPFLTVGSYQLADPVATLRSQAPPATVSSTSIGPTRRAFTSLILARKSRSRSSPPNSRKRFNS